MEKLNRDMGQYLRLIGNWLPCSGKRRKKILEEIGGRVRDYLAQHPEAGYGEGS